VARRVVTSALLLGVVGGATSEQAKIELLIDAVAHLNHAKFIRNGAEYDAAAAADHLRLKLGRAGDRVKTADDFIRLCGSTSSMSGLPYMIRYDDGREETSEAFLRARLAEIESSPP
jgi:uncharacterized protein DUF5329